MCQHDHQPIFDTNNNPSSSKFFKIQPVKGKGLGLIANQDLKVGTEILREKCVLSIQHHVMMKERIARNKTGVGDVLKSWLEILTLLILIVYIKIFCGDLEACCFIILALYRVIWCNIYSDILSSYSAISLMLTKATLAQKLDYLEDEIKSQLQSLTNVFTRTNIQYIDKMLGILCTNSFQLQEDTLPGHVTSGVFPLAARINHSCRSSCDYRVIHETDTDTWWISIVMIHPVPAGTELTLCYNNFLEADGPVVKKERRNYLMWAYRFRCKCEDCSLSGSESHCNDMMRSKIVQSRLDWTLTSDPVSERQLVLKQINLLKLLDCCGRMEYMIQAAGCGWDTEQDLLRKKILAEIGVEYSARLHGAHSGQTNLWEHRLHSVKKTLTKNKQK